jgi:hypothetical protein
MLRIFVLDKDSGRLFKELVCHVERQIEIYEKRYELRHLIENHARVRCQIVFHPLFFRLH